MMPLLFLLIFLSISIFLFFLLQKHNKTTKIIVNFPPLPGPKPLPFIGNLHQFDHSTPQTYLCKLSKHYGPLMSLRLGFVPILVVSSPKMSKEIFKTHDLDFCGRPSLLGQQKLSYNGLDLAFSPYNPYWKEMRKICVTHLFNSIRMLKFRHVREDEVLHLIGKISNFAVACEPINLSEMILFLTSSIICRVAFGTRYEEGRSERRRFHRLLNETQALLGSFFFSDYFPLMGWVDRLTGKISRLEKNFKKFNTFYQELIDEHLNSNRRKADHEDIIDVMLQVQKERGSKIDITPNHIKAVLMNVFVGGTDTVATAVIWTMTCLMKNPRTMKKAQEEIRYSIGEKGFVNEDDVQRLPYLKAVVKETMRLQPPIPLIPKATAEECILDGYRIPPKTLVYVNAWAIGRDPEVWENPEEFDPERFMGSTFSTDLRGQDFKLTPFGGGRRICPAMSMAISTVELAVSNLLYKFDWEMPTGMKEEDLDFDVLPGITMQKKNALRVIARKII